MNKLHLGCGNVRIPEYVNVDILPSPAVDLMCDVRELPFQEESFEVIYSCCIIEHFGRHVWSDLIRYWVRFLKPGGLFRIATCDFESVIAEYHQNPDLERLLGLLIGGQKDAYDWHGMIFNFGNLAQGLLEAGLENPRRYDWRTIDIGLLEIDDYSQAYLPHMDKENGRLMALNVEASKPM